MRELELCHWLLYEPSGNCRSVFAPQGDAFENYRRVGPFASSPQFVMPFCFAVTASPLEKGGVGNLGQETGELNSPFSKGGGGISREIMSLRFSFSRDDRDHQGSAFAGMETIKVATLVSELSVAIAAWVESVGNQFQAIKLSEASSRPIELLFQLKDSGPFSLERSLCLTKAGIEMMAYARGLKIVDWKV